MTAIPARARATLTAFGEVALSFPYSAVLVDALKTEISGRYRKWDGDEKRWLVMGAYREAAIGLLLEHFPRAEVPDNQPRRLPAPPARTGKTPASSVVPLPPIAGDGADESARDRLVASVRCPGCGTRHDQAVRVVAESAERVAKREVVAPELLTVCPNPSCRALSVVAFYPALAGAA